MPELPEVQTTVNDLKKRIIGKRIIGSWVDTPRIIKEPGIKKLGRQIKGLKIQKIGRRGKNILIYLSKNKLLLIHLKLTGRLLIGNRFLKNPKNYIRAVFYLSDKTALGFSDVRKFGKIIFGDQKHIESLPDLADLGLDPLDNNFPVDEFKSLIRKEKRKIKLVLLDQEVIAGIGNIYSDEALWYAKIHPFTPSNQLTNNQLTKLYHAIRLVLKKSLRVRGSSMRDYRDTSGRSGGYIKIRKVYDREGLPCYRCGTKIKRIKMNVRSAHFCPKCQK